MVDRRGWCHTTFSFFRLKLKNFLSFLDFLWRPFDLSTPSKSEAAEAESSESPSSSELSSSSSAVFSSG